MQYKQLQHYLTKHKVKYELLTHTPAYTAQEIAATSHIPGRDLAKTVIVKLDGRLAMLVIPANKMVNFDNLRKITGAKDIVLASEYEFEARFKGCEVGAMPPFGNLFEMPVYVDDLLLQEEKIAFNAGNHSELVRMSYDDWAKLVKPRVVHIH